MKNSNAFSLRSLFIICAAASLVLTMAGFAFRGSPFFVGATLAIFALLMATMGMGVWYWLMYLTASFFQRRRRGKAVRSMQVESQGEQGQ